MAEAWSAGDRYEPYVGRWSRVVAREFLPWLEVGPGASWLDVGCGTGALTQTILATQAPREVVGVDASAEYVGYAVAHTGDSRATFKVGDARSLPVEEAVFDASVSGLCLNFVPEPERAVREMQRVTRPGGVVAAYLWDYAEGMELMRHFWDAAGDLDPVAREMDEGPRFPLCRPGPLAELLEATGLQRVEVRAIDIPTVFANFDDYWSPFLGGQGPAPSYAMSLTEEAREALRERIRGRLRVSADGTIALWARAWAVRGTVA